MNRAIPVIVILGVVGLAGILLFAGPFAPQINSTIDEPIVDQPEPGIIPEPDPEAEPEPEVLPEPDSEFEAEPERELVEPEIFVGEVEITIEVFRFKGPGDATEITIVKGTTVTWVMMDRAIEADDPAQWHNVHFGPPPGQDVDADEERLQDGDPGPVEENISPDLGCCDERWSYTFNEIGEFVYHCHPHPWMIGKIIVVEGPSPMGAGVPDILEGRVEVSINNQGLFSFVQDDITVRVGATVVWIMGVIDDLYPAEHIIVSDDSDLFESMRLRTADENFSFTFEEVGIIRYHCSIHPFMTGTIRVIA